MGDGGCPVGCRPVHGNGMSELSFDDWLRVGLAHNWVGPPVCYTHDGPPASAAEEDALMDGDDLCFHIMRCYAEPEDRLLVEENHPPSKWRNSYGV